MDQSFIIIIETPKTTTILSDCEEYWKRKLYIESKKFYNKAVSDVTTHALLFKNKYEPEAVTVDITAYPPEEFPAHMVAFGFIRKNKMYSYVMPDVKIYYGKNNGTLI